jgi:hypothetical protein
MDHPQSPKLLIGRVDKNIGVVGVKEFFDGGHRSQGADGKSAPVIGAEGAGCPPKGQNVSFRVCGVVSEAGRNHGSLQNPLVQSRAVLLYLVGSHPRAFIVDLQQRQRFSMSVFGHMHGCRS